MSKIAYEQHNIQKTTASIIGAANQIIRKYMAAGLRMTLRQLHYQFVSANLYKNTTKNYKILGNAISTGRLLGMIDWDSIQDRLRERQARPCWENPQAGIKSLAKQFHLDLWADQAEYVEVWIEKDALSGIVESVCYPHGVGFMVCRGFASQTAMWEAGMRFGEQIDNGKTCTILYFGDHDPSGLDMTRDVRDRVNKFSAKHKAITVDRIALSMEQIDEFQLPPNPAKMSDSRAAAYTEEHGDSSWELDALPPDVLAGLITSAIEGHADIELFKKRVELDKVERKNLRAISRHYHKITAILKGQPAPAQEPEDEEEDTP